MVRNANDITSLSLDAFAIGLESTDPKDIAPTSNLIARLAFAGDTLPLRGAELVTGQGWIGIRSHPSPAVTASTGGGEIPLWVDAVFQDWMAPSDV
jgi:hypothetical protein